MPSPPLKNKTRDEAVDWVLRLRAERVTPEDRQAFANWLAQDAAHQALYDKLAARWDTLGQLKGADFPLRRQALSYRPPARPAWHSWAGLAAASVLLAVSVSFGMPGIWQSSDARYSTRHGQHDSVQLTDGSRLELNSDTEVHVHMNYWQRSVELLRGEAFFTVVHDENHPFVVTAANGKIEDIGTEFDVYVQADTVLVGVQTSEVRVYAKQNRDLSARQSLAYNRAGEFVSQVPQAVENVTAWRQGQLVFGNRRLDDVLAELARYHSVKLSLASPGLANLKVSGRFQISRLNSALEAIAATLPVTVQHRSAHEVVLKKR